MAEPTLGSISTVWSDVRRAHEGPPAVAARAHEALARRYRGAVFRYLLRVGCTPESADEVTQRFLVSLWRGELRHADPARGSFRGLLKRAALRQLGKYRREQRAGPLALPPDSPAFDRAAREGPDFDSAWRDELLARTWEALAHENPRYHAVLRLRADHPRLPSHTLARQLGERLGAPLSAGGVRKTLERARRRFVELLAGEVACSLEGPTPERVREELAELGLLEFCPAEFLAPADRGR